MNKELLSILACPKCLGGLEEEKKYPEGLYCKNCHVVYPIVDDIPILLIEQALEPGSPTTLIGFDE